MKGERNANGGRRVENEIRDNYQFIHPARASHFRYVSKTISIPEDLGRRCYWRTYRSRRGILDTSRKFQRRFLDCVGLLIRCHSIPLWSDHDHDLVALFGTLGFEYVSSFPLMLSLMIPAATSIVAPTVLKNGLPRISGV
jgi:hypothetical protein